MHTVHNAQPGIRQTRDETGVKLTANHFEDDFAFTRRAKQLKVDFKLPP